MAKFAAILFAAFAFQAVWAAPATQTAEKTQLEELGTKIQTATSEFTTTLQKNLPDVEEVKTVLTTRANDFTHELENILKKFQTEIDSGKSKRDDLLKDFSGKISENIASLQKLTGPDATKKANEIQTQIKTNFNELATEFENFGKTVEPTLKKAGDDFGTFASSVLNDFFEATKKFQTEVEQGVSKH